MKTLMTVVIRVTTPYKVDNESQIKQDYQEVFTTTLQQVIKDELSNLGIVGLAVQVKVM